MTLRHAFRATTRSLSVVRRVPCSAAARTIHLLSHHHRAVAPSPIACPRRYLATPPPQIISSDLDPQLYHLYSDTTMDRLFEALEDLLDEVAAPENEVEYASGVLTLKLGDKGTYVINKQPPNKQIWLSSPFSGPKRYDFIPQQRQWVYSRDKCSLHDLLNQELSEALQRTVELDLSVISQLGDQLHE